MDYSETDRVVASELRGLIKDLRDKNKELTDKQKKASASALAWVIVALVLAAVCMMTCGADAHPYYHR